MAKKKKKTQRTSSKEVRELNSTIAHNIRQMRTNAGLTQMQLAMRAGTCQPFISKVECGGYPGSLTLSTLNNIADALDSDIEVYFNKR